MFDSHSRNSSGMVDPNGSSVLLQFNEIIQLEKYVWQLTQNFHQNLFSMTFVDITIISKKALDLGIKRTRPKKTESTLPNDVQKSQPQSIMDTIQTEAHNTENSLQKDVDIHNHQTVSDTMANYFTYQKECNLKHQLEKAEYIRTYMQKTKKR